jgi:hypothetical protein
MQPENITIESDFPVIKNKILIVQCNEVIKTLKLLMNHRGSFSNIHGICYCINRNSFLGGHLNFHQKDLLIKEFEKRYRKVYDYYWAFPDLSGSFLDFDRPELANLVDKEIKLDESQYVEWYTVRIDFMQKWIEDIKRGIK